LCRLFKLNQGQELVFVLALRNSTHIELQTLAHDYIQKRLPEWFQTISESGGMIHQNIRDWEFSFFFFL
jgi:hypothetical protein